MYTDKIINYKNIIKQTKLYNKGKFFNYSIIDDFFELDFANKLCKTTVSLPAHLGLKKKDIFKIIKIVKETL